MIGPGSVAAVEEWIFEAKRVRYVASSKAVSPPPTTAISRSRKKNPSQVAQADTPRPRRRCSLSMSSQMADAPVAMITDSPRYSVPRAQTRNGRLEKSTRSMSTSTRVVPNLAACARKRPMRSGPSMPSGKPG
jgi:hypothetical protein